MAPNLRQPESLTRLCSRAMILYLWNLHRQLMPVVGQTSTHGTRSKSTTVALPHSYVAFLQSYFECRIPPAAYDGLRDEFLTFIANAYKRIPHNFQRQESYLRTVSMYAPVWWTVISGHCQYLHFDELPEYLYRFFWDGLKRLKGLRSIDLSYEFNPINASTIVRCFAHWPELQHFGDPNCSDTILVALSDLCPKLNSLDVSDSIQITDASVDILLRFREMKCLYIDNTQVTFKGYSRLMDGLPRLERLSPCGSWPDYSPKHYPILKTFALTHFCGDPKCSFTAEQLQFLSTHCPNLCYICICGYDYVFDWCDRKHWIAIEKLRALCLSSFHFHTQKIHDLLLVKGHNLVYLEMDGVVDMQGLICISKYCPNLVELVLELHPTRDDTPYIHVERVNHPFKHLKILSLSGVFGDDHLEYTLGNCFNIERIDIEIWYNAFILEDWHFDKILETNPLQHVRSILIPECDITIEGAQRLVDTCPELRTLGSTMGWNFKPADRQLLQSYIRERNYAVVLT